MDTDPMYIHSTPPSYTGPTRQNSGDTFSSVSSSASVFSHADSYSSNSSARPPNPHFVGLNTPPPQHAPDLPCEFSIYTQCGATFSSDQEAEWIEHHTHHHLRDHLPKIVRCPLCDEWVFNYHDQRDQRQTNFWNRMRHWAGHYTSGERVGRLREDHYMIAHLGKKGLISQAQLQSAMAATEMGADVWAPVSEGARPHDWVTPRQRTQNRLDNQMVVNQRDEDRRRRREQGRR